MKIVNRGFIKVNAKQPFVDWANAQDEEFVTDINAEPNIYLIEDDFYDEEPIIKANFKKIFTNELEMVTDNEENYPEIKMDTFNEWFSIELGTSVFDCQPSNILAD